MKNKQQGDLSSLDELQENLNPDFSYIIFESHKMPEDEVDFSEVSSFIKRLKFKVVEEKIFRDRLKGTSVMMFMLHLDAKVDMQEMFDLKSPENFSYYIFRKNN